MISQSEWSELQQLYPALGEVGPLMEFAEMAGFAQINQRLAHSLRDRPKVIDITHQQLAEEVGSVNNQASALSPVRAERDNPFRHLT